MDWQLGRVQTLSMAEQGLFVRPQHPAQRQQVARNPRDIRLQQYGTRQLDGTRACSDHQGLHGQAAGRITAQA